MISFDEACNSIKKKHSSETIRNCLDFGTFFLFVLCPYYAEQSYLSGTEFPAIDKKTGKEFIYDVSSDIEAYEKAKTVPIKTVWDQKI